MVWKSVVAPASKTESRKEYTAMDVIYSHVCGLDVHKKTVVACVLTPEVKEIRTYATMTDDLLQMVDWLKEQSVTHVAMESTGSYWKPIYNLLEASGLSPLVVNAKHIKNVPGRKTDVRDAEWIASLLQRGLLKGSYIPPRDQRELRELLKYRRSLIQERAREINRIQKVLEGANIKLSSVATDILGKSSRAMLEAIIAGEEDPEVLSSLALGRLKNKREELKRALRGLIGPHLRFMLEQQLRHIDALTQLIVALDEEIERQMRPFERPLERIRNIEGLGKRTTQEIIGVIGTDMNRFPTAAHLASWAGVAPGNNESAGKRRSGRTTKGNPLLRSALIEAAHAAARTKNTFLSRLYHRLAARRGSKRAIVAVAHRILVIIYHLLKEDQEYRPLSPTYYEERRREQIKKQAIRKLNEIGYKVVELAEIEQGA